MKIKKPIENIKTNRNVKKNKKMKSDQFWLDAFKIKPVEVRVHRIQGKW